MPNDLPAVDETVRMPESVRRAAAEAEARHKAVYGTPTTPEPQPTGDAPVGDGDKPISIVDTAPKPLPRISTPGGDKIILPKAAPPPASEPAPQPSTAQPQPPVDPQSKPTLTLTPRGSAPAEPQAPVNGDPQAMIDYLQHQVRSSHGRQEQLQRTLQMTQDQLVQMGDEVSRLTQVALGQREPTAVRRAEIPTNLPAMPFTPEERQAYGDEALQVMARAGRAAVEPLIAELQAQNQQTREQLEQEKKLAIKRSNEAALDAAVENWRAINVSQEFYDWLSLPDFYSGVPKGRLLQEAYHAGQSARVVRFFQGFIADTMSRTAVPGVTAATPVATRPGMTLAAYAAPGPAKPAGGPGDQPTEKPIYTHAEIANFYSEVRRGLWANRPEQKAAIEADIIAAGREGRVR